MNLLLSTAQRLGRRQTHRLFTTSCRNSNAPSEDLRMRLMVGVKLSMKNKDTATSTTLRSVLSDIYSADKIAGSPISSPTAVTILRKAIARRLDAAAKFSQASRPDLAEKEREEVETLSGFLPALLSEAEIDHALREALGRIPETKMTNVKKTQGLLFKEFYARIDKSRVDSDLVTKRTISILNEAAL